MRLMYKNTLWQLNTSYVQCLDFLIQGSQLTKNTWKTLKYDSALIWKLIWKNVGKWYEKTLENDTKLDEGYASRTSCFLPLGLKQRHPLNGWNSICLCILAVTEKEVLLWNRKGPLLFKWNWCKLWSERNWKPLKNNESWKKVETLMMATGHPFNQRIH